MRVYLVTIGLLLCACHSIEHSTSPIGPTSAPSMPTILTIIQTPGELPIGGGEAVFKIGVMSQAGIGVADIMVALRASAGTLAAEAARTDHSGYATVQWSGTRTSTVTASIGDLTAAATIPVHEPPVLPPPSPVPPPRPVPPPDPIPPIPPSLTVTALAVPLQVAVGAVVTLTTTVENLNPGESVTAYQWDWEGAGKGTTFDETSVSPSRAHLYATDGIKAPIVGILTSSGRAAFTTGRVIVYKP